MRSVCSSTLITKMWLSLTRMQEDGRAYVVNAWNGRQSLIHNNLQLRFRIRRDYDVIGEEGVSNKYIWSKRGIPSPICTPPCGLLCPGPAPHRTTGYSSKVWFDIANDFFFDFERCIASSEYRVGNGHTLKYLGSELVYLWGSTLQGVYHGPTTIVDFFSWHHFTLWHYWHVNAWKLTSKTAPWPETNRGKKKWHVLLLTCI